MYYFTALKSEKVFIPNTSGAQRFGSVFWGNANRDSEFKVTQAAQEITFIRHVTHA